VSPRSNRLPTLWSINKGSTPAHDLEACRLLRPTF
jgi:hypothetical protein